MLSYGAFAKEDEEQGAYGHQQGVIQEGDDVKGGESHTGGGGAGAGVQQLGAVGDDALPYRGEDVQRPPWAVLLPCLPFTKPPPPAWAGGGG